MARKTRAAGVKRSHRHIYLGLSALILLVATLLVVRANLLASDGAVSGGDITITKSEVTAKAAFIPYKAGNIKMEVLAIKAPDGTVRTAFNTCQVCYDSGRGYYKQQGDELVCQNCGNRFTANEVERQIGGCNPVPILEENKTDDGATIVIPQSFLERNKGLFGKWKKA